MDRGKVVAEGTPDELKRELHGDALYVELAGVGDLNGNVHTALSGLDAAEAEAADVKR